MSSSKPSPFSVCALAVLTLISTLLVLSAAAIAAPGDPDRSFGDRGAKTQMVGSGEHQRSSAFVVAPSDRTVAVLKTAPGNGRLARFTVDGELDHTFGDRGFVESTGPEWTAVSLDPEGRILVAGVDGTTVSITRFSGDGEVDSGFADDGTWRLDLLPLAGPYSEVLKVEPEMLTVAATGDGSVTAAAKVAECRYDHSGFYEGDGETPCPSFAAIRLTEEGAPDPSFGESGIRVLALPDRDPTAGVLPDGRIIFLGGYERDSDDGGIEYRLVLRFVDRDGEALPPVGDPIAYSPSHPAGRGEVTTDSKDRILVAVGRQIFRMDGTGSLDDTFDENGAVAIDNGPTWNDYRGGNVELNGIAVDADDRVLVAGNAFRNRVRTGYVARFREDGSADPTFSNDGFAGTWSAPVGLGPKDFRIRGTRVRVDGRGRVVVGGGVATPAGMRTAFARRLGGSMVEPRCMGRRPTYIGGPGTDVVGGRGTGVIVTGGGDDVVKNAGYARICTGAGNDKVEINGLTRIDLGPGDDVTTVGPRDTGRDVVLGGPGNDVIRTGKGNDRLLGGPGRDTLVGGDGDDVLRGGAGRDRLFGNRGNDHLFGGPGRDLLDAGPAAREELVYGVDNPRIRLKLYRYRGSFVRLGYHIKYTCASGGMGSITSTSKQSIAIDPNSGRFSYGDSDNDDWHRFDMRLTGRIDGSTVTGRIKYVDTTFWPGCWTGESKRDPWVEFRARALPVVRQVARQ